MLASLVFLTPAAGLVALAVLLPVAAFVLAERRVAVVRQRLDLPAPRGGRDVVMLAALVGIVAALALASAQPALSTTQTQRVRTDAQMLFVLDVSQSMAAAAGPRRPTRLDRAVTEAVRLRSSLREIPAGLATLTDRVIPNLLPVPDVAAFGATAMQTVAINTPPPRELNVRATNFAALSGVPSSGYFQESAKQRLIILLTDGESSFFDAATVGKALAAKPRTQLLVVQFWRSSESIFARSGKPDPHYRPDAAARTQLASLATATHGRVFTEGKLGAVADTARAMMGAGPTQSVGRERTTYPLAPYAALLALIPLSLVFTRNLRVRAA